VLGFLAFNLTATTERQLQPKMILKVSVLQLVLEEASCLEVQMPK
jgi:hypothetical protein